MTAISFANNLKSLIRGAHSLFVIAPAALLRAKHVPAGLARTLGKRQTALLVQLANDTRPGARGATASTLSSGKLQRLRVGVLPDSVSRYNSPARAEAIRRVISSAGIASKGKTAIALVLEDDDHVLAAVNAVGRGLPLFSAKSGSRSGRAQLVALDSSGREIEIPARVEHTLTAARDAADLGDTPPTDLNPAAFAKRARALLKGLARVKVREIAGDALIKNGLRGIHAVGRCAVDSPRMLIANYEPAKASRTHVALVGKGVTFDTGGLHLKHRGYMETMKGDMCGAAAVLGAFRVLAATGFPHRITLLLCMAENAIGPAAYKPDDILTMHSGKTVEINNTDAEGRLLLADGVSYAARVLKADVIFDAATLTGAQLVATGLLHAAVMSNDAELEHSVVEAGRRSGDLAHPLPFAPEFFQSEFESPVADMRNSVANRGNAQSSCAAQFVYAHIADAPQARRRRWCHVDLAGPAFPKDRATGYGVALLAESVAALA